MTRQVFTIGDDAITRFREGATVDDRARHGEPIKGRIIEVKSGNKVALVIMDATEAS